jgi:2-amino-4-hydroxy-6-hydroxymethyldihydropteridine diphosphokinase
VVRAAAYVGVGANVGDAAATVRAAFGRLAGLAPARLSSLYQTEPVGPVRDQPWFVNACVELVFDVATAPSPRGLLDVVLEIERGLGRDRARERPGGPRAIDLDLLTWGALVVRERDLTIPHPRLASRAFALAPLVELAGEDLVIPGAGPAGALLRAALADPTQRVRKIV